MSELRVREGIELLAGEGEMFRFSRKQSPFGLHRLSRGVSCPWRQGEDRRPHNSYRHGVSCNHGEQRRGANAVAVQQ
jgi:hypothetical protein